MNLLPAGFSFFLLNKVTVHKISYISLFPLYLHIFCCCSPIQYIICIRTYVWIVIPYLLYKSKIYIIQVEVLCGKCLEKEHTTGCWQKLGLLFNIYQTAQQQYLLLQYIFNNIIYMENCTYYKKCIRGEEVKMLRYQSNLKEKY